jgi:hypothetical protein
MATLLEKVDDFNKKNTEPSKNEEGEESAPPQPDDGENVTSAKALTKKTPPTGTSSANNGSSITPSIVKGSWRASANEKRSDLAPSSPAYFNIDDQVARRLADSKFAAKRSKYSITAADAFFTSFTNETQKDAMQALEAGNYGAAQRLFRQVCNNLEATRDMQWDKMMFLDINSDPGATSKPKSFANDTLRNEFCPGVTDRGGSSRTQKNLQLYEEQCLKATLGASAKAQANHHLAVRQYNTSGAGAISARSSKKAADRKPSKTGT